MLIYEPQADGTLQLVAVENLVFMKAWEAAGNTLPPSFHGVPYDRMVDDRPRKWTRRTASSRIMTGMSGCIGRIRRVFLRPSIRQ
jgi:hypothetical protein